MKLLPTRHDLPENVRAAITPILQENLALCFDLLSQAKQAHWNVKGLSFLSLHELFDKLAQACDGFVDDLAERMVQLGGTPLGTVKDAAAQSSLPAYPQIYSGIEHVRSLADRISHVARSVRESIEKTNSLGDADTADLFTEISRELDKLLWFVEAHDEK